MFKDKRILITGASSGIGAALARRFARDGARVMLVARRVERLEQLAKEIGNATVIGADLVATEGARGVVDAARRASGRIDVLVNNAGVGEYGAFAGQDLGALEQMMELNMGAMVRMTHLVLPEMRDRGEGRILNIASTASFQPTPYMAVYGATKAFVRSWSLSLWRELKGSGVSVTCVCPGPVRTEFFDRGGFEDRRGEFTKVAVGVEWMAEKAYQAVARGKAVSTPGLVNWVGAWLTRFADQRTVTRISARILGPRATSHRY